ncbi:MAG: putative DNA modification/repair radical SAM protein [Alphaproteobacteria bacterium]|nr:MAG: putative DNA modification/repair radical SAM protein [Alphaproteobacteria bacterium]
MNVAEKLAILADAAKYDASCASGGGRGDGLRQGKLGNTRTSGICHSYTPDGRCVSLLKILMTNFCVFDCKYCVNRISSDVPRARFTVQEIVDLTLDFYRRNYIEGLFLSSGIIRNGDYTMEQMVAVARTLRVEHGFGGYIHLKTIPGASPELLREAGMHADRLSINIELPTEADLEALAPDKKRPLLEGAMQKVKIAHDELKDARKAGLKKVPRFIPGGQSTQMIVGATPTADREILGTAASLYGKHKLRRVYYSAFSPIPHGDARLPLMAAPLMREHRLYQADWLLRFYGFRMDELTTDAAPNLALEHDPKVGWALRNPQAFPVDINKASRAQLLRVPGIGTRGMARILSARRHHTLRVGDLAMLGVALNRAEPFVCGVDLNPQTQLLGTDRLRLKMAAPQAAQLSLGI